MQYDLAIKVRKHTDHVERGVPHAGGRQFTSDSDA